MRAKKSLGQHFLNSAAALAKIIAAADLSADDTVLEIGPGKGVLTKALCAAARRVVAIEKDEALAAALATTLAEEVASGKLSIVSGDILTADLAALGLRDHAFKAVANIPYYITGSILRKLFSGPVQPIRAVLLVQKEVAERIARSEKESVVSLSVKAYGTPRYVATVKAGSFSPPPKVDSAILSVANISRDFFNNIPEGRFFEIIKAGFGSKRKFLINNLECFAAREELAAAFTHAGIAPKARAEDVALSQWKDLIGFLPV